MYGWRMMVRHIHGETGVSVRVLWEDSSFGIATRYGMEELRIEVQWAARFSAQVLTATRTHSSSCTMVILFLSLKETRRGLALNMNPRLAPRLKKWWSYDYIYTSFLWTHYLFWGDLYRRYAIRTTQHVRTYVLE